MRRTSKTDRNPARENISYETGGHGVSVLESLEKAPEYSRWVADLILPFAGNLNLEMGPGLGVISDTVAKYHKLHLVELSVHLRKQLKAKYKDNRQIKSVVSSLDEASSSGLKLNSIYSVNVMEHIKDDIDVIIQSAKLLLPGGFFVAFVPAGRLLYSDFDREIGHYRRYSRMDRTRIVTAAESCGLTLIQYKYLNPIGALGWFVNFKLLRKKTPGRRSVQMHEKLMPLIRFISRFPLPFGQSLLIVLKKN